MWSSTFELQLRNVCEASSYSLDVFIRRNRAGAAAVRLVTLSFVDVRLHHQHLPAAHIYDVNFISTDSAYFDIFAAHQYKKM